MFCAKWIKDRLHHCEDFVDMYTQCQLRIWHPSSTDAHPKPTFISLNWHFMVHFGMVKPMDKGKAIVQKNKSLLLAKVKSQDREETCFVFYYFSPFCFAAERQATLEIRSGF